MDFKINETVYALDVYKLVEVTILESYEDYEHDESNRLVTFFRTNNGIYRKDELFRDKKEASWRIQRSKSIYDTYVTSKY